MAAHRVLPGAWLYHGLYYYTRNGLQSGLDHLNTVSNYCTDPTLTTFLNYFDPIAYAPTQHGPLLTIIGTHDQFFTVPAINYTYDRIAGAGASPRFLKRIMMKPNVKHGVETNGNLLYTYTSLYDVIQGIDSWFKYCFKNGSVPPGTPTVRMEAKPTTMVFHVTAPAGGSAINQVKLYYASQIDTRPSTVYDFGYVSLSWNGLEYVGTIPIGKLPSAGPPVTPNNIIYLASVKDGANYTVTSKLYYRSGVMALGRVSCRLSSTIPGIRCRFRLRLIALDCGESDLDIRRGKPNRKHPARECKSSASPWKDCVSGLDGYWEQSVSLTHIAATESVSLCTRMKKV
ncbi:MAG TPA: PhoPQ-activated protein PqaA family protein [Candidatus Udaeobacter sp.]